MMEYVAGAVQRVIVKADFVRNHAILQSCDNLTFFFSHFETLFSLFICQRSTSHMSSNGQQLFLLLYP